MMNTSTILLVLAALTAYCNGAILYDVQVSEVVEGKEVKTEESEIFIEERFLTPEPPTIEMNSEDDEDEDDGYIGRASYNLSDFQSSFEKSDGAIPEEHQTFDLGFGAGLVNSPEWSDWTCCRRVVNIQSRERVRQAPRIELEYKRCRSNYCDASMCKDNINICNHFLKSMGQNLCQPTNMMSTFMSHHCPLSCNFCNSPQPTRPSFPWQQPTDVPAWWRRTRATTKRPETTAPWWARRTTATTRAPAPETTVPWWATRRTTRQPPAPETTLPWWATRRTTTTTEAMDFGSNLAKVTIFSHNRNPPHPSYEYSIDQWAQPQFPWKRIPEGGSELSHFYLYKQPTALYTMPVRFCSARDRDNGIKKWTVSRRRCGNGWNEEFKLYASLYRSKTSQLYYVANRGRPYWTARVSDRFPSNGYTSGLFYFYGPKSGGVAPPVPTQPTTTQRPRTTPPWQATTRRTTQTPWWMSTTRRPEPTPWTPPRPTTTQRPPIGGGGGRPSFPVSQPNQPFQRSVFNQNCLRAHNFFRAVHNVPPLKWDPEIARTAQAWATALKEIAPERPNNLVQAHRRTPNWPHSESGKGYRNRGDGENIAWDLSNDGSPVEESVLRWYSEIFYYDRRNPTRAPAPDKPVGHLTQMLWKDTTHLGCGVAVTEVPYSRYTLKSTWTVSHYSPGGNVRYPSQSQTNQLYNEQVPDMENGACMTRSGSCNNGNQCMAFGPSRGTCNCNGGSPTCRSAGGCIAWCENRSGNYPWKAECAGKSQCSCGPQGATCD